VVTTEKVGAGADCPELQTEIEGAYDFSQTFNICSNQLSVK